MEPAGAAPTPAPQPFPRIRLWPALIFVVLQWLALMAPRLLGAEPMIQFYGLMLGPLIGTVGVLLWWLFASRIRWKERFLGVLAFVAIGAVAYLFFHPSFDVMGVFFMTLPMATTAIAVWLLVTPFLRWPIRRAGLLVVVMLTWGYYTLVRFEGVYGDISATLSYRWIPTAEDRYRADVASGKLGTGQNVQGGAAKLSLKAGDWPGFRGANRDGRLKGVQITTNWAEEEPKLVWRHRVGPGWSSFAVIGKHLFTQEQLDADELVICYDADTGKVIWIHKDTARFAEKVGGPGPRATPTFHNGNLYVLGATGILNCLDAAMGKTVWSRDIVADSGAKVPIWGFASSPLVTQGVVTVFAGAADGKSVLGYDAKTGKPAWQAGEGQLSYSSLQPAQIGGVEQVLMVTDLGLTAFQPARGDVLWNHPWTTDGVQRVVQPAMLNETEVLLGSPFGKGARRVRVEKQGAGWDTKEIWTTQAISPYFNDLVIEGNHLYGFDGPFLACVNLEEGKRKWKARGYGTGQVLLLADQKLLLVLSETGFVALVEAKPEGHKEIGRFQALSGKTWNHPVVAHGKLFVRNSEEAACYQLKATNKK
jgi:outer membrane protein assembly factor BamB